MYKHGFLSVNYKLLLVYKMMMLLLKNVDIVLLLIYNFPSPNSRQKTYTTSWWEEKVNYKVA